MNEPTRPHRTSTKRLLRSMLRAAEEGDLGLAEHRAEIEEWVRLIEAWDTEDLERRQLMDTIKRRAADWRVKSRRGPGSSMRNRARSKSSGFVSDIDALHELMDRADRELVPFVRNREPLRRWPSLTRDLALRLISGFERLDQVHPAAACDRCGPWDVILRDLPLR